MLLTTLAIAVPASAATEEDEYKNAKEKLTTLVSNAKTLYTSKITCTDLFEFAYLDAEACSKNSKATIEEINTNYEALTEALELISEDVLANLKTLVEATESWYDSGIMAKEPFKSAYEAAEKYCSRGSTDSIAMKQAFDKLSSSLVELVEKLDKDDDYKANFAEESWTAFMEQITEDLKKDVKSDDDMAAKMVAVNLLISAKDLLEALPFEDDFAKQKMNIFVTVAELLNSKGYPSTAWGMVNMKLEQAKKVCEEPTKTDYINAVNELETALINLTDKQINIALPEVPAVKDLKELYDDVEKNYTKDYFTEENWVALEAAKKDAKDVIDMVEQHNTIMKEYKTASDLYAQVLQDFYDAAEEAEAKSVALDDLKKPDSTATDTDIAIAEVDLEEAIAVREEKRVIKDEQQKVVYNIIERMLPYITNEKNIKDKSSALVTAMNRFDNDLPTEAPTDDVDKNTGCGSVIGVGAVALVSVLVMGVALKKKEN